MSTPPQPTRRAVVAGAAGVAATAATTATASPATAAGSPGSSSRTIKLSVLGTTDLHGNVFNWDYYKDTEFDDSAHNDIGVAKVKTVIDRERAARDHPVLVLDAGDTIQGTPLAYYYAKVQPIGGNVIHPMARAMNLIGYDAAALGNHEFNYGIPLLRTFESQLNFPLLGANAVDPVTKRPVFAPYIIKRIKVDRAPDLVVGILGLTNPGIAIWDHANVEGKMEFPGLVEQAKKFVPELKAKGCDVVIVSAHSGPNTSSSYGDALPYPENAATLVAQEVAGVDAILVGHAHLDVPTRVVDSLVTEGKQVVLCEPLFWGKKVAVFDMELERHGRRWSLVGPITSTTLPTNTAEPDPDVSAAVQEQHDTVIDYVNSVVGTSTVAMSADRAVVEDTPIIDFVNYVQALTVRAALTGADAALPMLSIAAPFNRGASFPQGDVTIRDVAGLYIFDNTLLGSRVTGAQVKDYLEFSANYFKAVDNAGPVAIDDVIRAVTPSAPTGTPDYNYDIVAGLEDRLTYDIDLAQPVGSRITNLQYAGAALDPAQEFVMAVNNYRQGGGGNFPHIKDAPVVYNAQVEIRQLLIDWVVANGEIDPAQFASMDWRLVYDQTPMTIT
ncbi:5'-nucleotidase C-terminal domain-containing protein [Nocardioides agariphilus]|jgi:2',3'-cyclic-nucleotide 2'-phosphodiesterase/3'-nucleotidase|uniref:5'-nucleotidase C-terminal domain-containing protein n=1 Tax=Nocardioides agariphilus TaxID=433664 RepID=A0A930YI95_9ACTN|nr:5'-nucleotidase C-terminal domain-containing protein [Nocardioides agariphilus]MBF4767863.1 5'-nucleotidase C-terminal domain-containing protein [Nocardioides agariphilus]